MTKLSSPIFGDSGGTRYTKKKFERFWVVRLRSVVITFLALWTTLSNGLPFLGLHFCPCLAFCPTIFRRGVKRKKRRRGDFDDFYGLLKKTPNHPKVLQKARKEQNTYLRCHLILFCNRNQLLKQKTYSHCCLFLLFWYWSIRISYIGIDFIEIKLRNI